MEKEIIRLAPVYMSTTFWFFPKLVETNRKIWYNKTVEILGKRLFYG